ncbi:MAG: UvrD-helicase domain-containing protein [Ideonella sp.]|nr:UvrD-helicase domain-containing protein [Ideonella sp.]MCC7458402.1 UvrD-helicase domain-containing protein [Nitrospira sp.]
MSPPATATLNAAQLRAVHHTRGPCLVLAGAGSGKTRVIVHKIAHLLRGGVEAPQIAAITFTNKAAAEMRERARAMVGGRAAQALVLCTFHALGVRILREHGEALGLKPRFSILDSDDVLAVLRDAGGTTDAAQARRWQWTISRWKNQGLTADGAEQAAAAADERVAARVMRRYEERLAAYQATDFDDLIGLPLKLLRMHDDVRQLWQQRLAHVLIDEVQDTNAVQYELLKALVGDATTGARGANPFTAVGDDDQSIYGWRGATIDNLKRLPQDYPALEVVMLEQNYRSTGAILRAANHVIAANPKLFAKKLWSELGEGEPVKRIECDNEEHEAERAVAWIQARRAGTPGDAPARWRDFALLYRANHQAKVFEQALRRAQMPYQVSGGQSFFDRAEIKDLCAWLRLLVNNDDDPAFLRAVTAPKRGIGHQSLAALGEFAAKWKVSLFEALFVESLGGALPRKAVDALREYGRFVNDLEYRARHTTGTEAARTLLTGWLADIGYEQHLHEGEDRARLAEARWANVLEFVDWVARRCGGEAGADGVAREATSVLQVAQTISLMHSIAERGDDADVVTLSTLHAAKGLEWPHVMLAGVNEGLLPFASEAEPVTAQRLEEERRLMYVGVTRAQRTLALSTLKRRKRGRDTVAAQPSRFIAEMKLDEARAKVDPRERLKQLRAELLAKTARPAEAEP